MYFSAPETDRLAIILVPRQSVQVLQVLPTILQLCQCISDQHHLCCATDGRFILNSRHSEFLKWRNGQQGMRLRSSLLFHLQLKLETNVLSSGTSTLAIAVCILGGPVSSDFFLLSPSIHRDTFSLLWGCTLIFFTGRSSRKDEITVVCSLVKAK